MYTTPQPISRMAASLLVATLFGAALFIQPAPVNAFGGGGGGAPKPAPSQACSAKTTQSSCQALNHCWWSSSSKKCKKKKNQSEIDSNDKLYAHGLKLAKSGEYAKAIEVLKTANQNDPHVLNYLGYSYRKSGDLMTGIEYYKLALAIDPDFVLAREYLGEGYVKAGRVDLAKLELEEIAKRCGTTCEEYIELAEVIENSESVIR